MKIILMTAPHTTARTMPRAEMELMISSVNVFLDFLVQLVQLTLTSVLPTRVKMVASARMALLNSFVVVRLDILGKNVKPAWIQKSATKVMVSSQ